MSTSKARAGSPWQYRSAFASVSRSSTAVASPRCSCVSTMAAPKRARMASRIAPPCTGSIPLRAGRDLVLQLHEAVEDRLGTRRTTRDVDVHGDDRIDALHGGIVVVEATGA